MVGEITQQNRYRTAAALLDNCAALARLARAAARVEASAAPCAVALAGGRRLHAAKRVGLFAGSFNPLTRAHVAVANAARRSAGLDALVWVCAAVSVDKERVERAALVDRLAQMRAFVAGRRHDALVLLNRGLYVDEAQLLRTLLPLSAQLHIVVGFDKIVQIFDPRYYDDRDAALRELFSLADILVSPRGSDGADALAELLAQPENRPFAPHVRYLDVPPAFSTDSSTEARAIAAQTPPDTAALERLLPPAGAALALHTRAYLLARPGHLAETDFYSIRECWLAALATQPERVTRMLPPLTSLVSQTQDKGARGRRLRAWLKATPHDAGALLAVLGDQASD